MKTFQEIREGTNSDLGHLAAKHYHHTAHGSDYSESPNPERHQKAAHATLNRIKKQHGAHAAKAVSDHSENAFAHDNGSVGPNKKFHHSFVSKHLGGNGSASHKQYKSVMKKNNHTENMTGQKMHHE